jgi:Holliday junction resolvase RusA-like endonuclease
MLEFHTKTKPVPQNRKLARGKGSRMYLNSEYLKAWMTIADEWKSQTDDRLIDSKVGLKIMFGWPRMDIDSCIKPILDTLQGIAYKNDKQVDLIHVSRISENEIKIEISPLV